jgi:hypothetical protein
LDENRSFKHSSEFTGRRFVVKVPIVLVIAAAAAVLYPKYLS